MNFCGHIPPVHYDSYRTVPFFDCTRVSLLRFVPSFFLGMKRWFLCPTIFFSDNHPLPLPPSTPAFERLDILMRKWVFIRLFLNLVQAFLGEFSGLFPPFLIGAVFPRCGVPFSREPFVASVNFLRPLCSETFFREVLPFLVLAPV